MEDLEETGHLEQHCNRAPDPDPNPSGVADPEEQHAHRQDRLFALVDVAWVRLSRGWCNCVRLAAASLLEDSTVVVRKRLVVEW